jgi:uncharacterized protein
MTDEVVDAAIDFWLTGARNEPRLDLSFYGGEPFLAAGLLKRAMERARRHTSAGQRLKFMTPTNGLLVDRAALDDGLDLAVSIDAVDRPCDRQYPNGEDPVPRLLATLPDLLPHAPLARMTVTPMNVGRLCRNVQAVARLGFRRIVFQPAWELAWDAMAIDTWAREHARLLTWAVGAHYAGVRIPDLPNLNGIEARLRRGTQRKACGSGVELAAVATDGSVFPCYRFVFGSDYRLGDVASGITQRGAQEEFASLDPDGLRSEDGSCATCAARDGCTHFCPALGHQMCGDLRRVPGVVCALTRAQVLAVRSAIG